MDPYSLNPNARDLEEEFFAKENQRLLERLREKRQRETRRAALREVMPKADDAFIDHMLELGIGPETILAITFVPLVTVAWADGNVADNEREAILIIRTTGSLEVVGLVGWRRPTDPHHGEAFVAEGDVAVVPRDLDVHGRAGQVEGGAALRPGGICYVGDHQALGTGGEQQLAVI